MSGKPIFVATHPRACSTAFERVFMTRTDTLQCVHEPFGDAFYYGSERLSSRFENDEQKRVDSGFSGSVYATVIERLEAESKQISYGGCSSSVLELVTVFMFQLYEMIGKRLFVKDIIHYLCPSEGKPATLAPSLATCKRGIGTDATTSAGQNGTMSSQALPYPYKTAAEPGNPTVIPQSLLQKFHFTFLIRHPRKSIPSYYRCTIPPLSDLTGFDKFMPSEAGYDELRRFFDYVKNTSLVGPQVAGKANNHASNGDHPLESGIEICVIDAHDLLDNPAGIIEAYCRTVGLDHHESMLQWNQDDDHKQAKDAFGKWKGFHEDAIGSSDLKPRRHKVKPMTSEEEDREWETNYGSEAAKIIRETVGKNTEDYEYLKQFALQV